MCKTIYLLTPVTPECKGWVEEHVEYQDWNILGNGIGIETRYVGPIVNGLEEAGFLMDQDFTLD